MSYFETRTQEDIAAVNTLGCKSCGQPVKVGDWYVADGDAYGKCCAKELRTVGAKPVKLPARGAKTLWAVRLTNGAQVFVKASSAADVENAVRGYLAEWDMDETITDIAAGNRSDVGPLHVVLAA